jgi:hypothetical protein
LEQVAAAFCGAGHEVPHLPQFSGSVFVSTHCPPQAENPGSQSTPHLPFSHVGLPLVGSAQAPAQLPQWSTSLARSTHDAPHCTRLGLQASAQLPMLHTLPVSQTVVHLPQWSGSVLKLTQPAAPQLWKGSSQTAPHWPLEQAGAPWGTGGQALEQAPQLFGSLSRSRQT